jgi:hypothetical protein
VLGEAKAMDNAIAVSRPVRRFLISILLILLSALPLAARAQQHPAARGAMSAQDMAKMAAPAAVGSDSADQVCARFSTGAVVSAPPELKSQNGVLEVTMQFFTTTDSQGLVRYCSRMICRLLRRPAPARTWRE